MTQEFNMKINKLFLLLGIAITSMAMTLASCSRDDEITSISFSRLFSALGLEARVQNQINVRLTWEAVSGADSYIVNVYESVNQEGEAEDAAAAGDGPARAAWDAGDRDDLAPDAAKGAGSGGARARRHPAHGRAARAARRRGPALCRPAQLGGVAVPGSGRYLHRHERGAGAPGLCRQRPVPDALAV